MNEKADVTVRFLKRKMDEYEQLQVEIEQLRRETKRLGLRTHKEVNN